jgi:hypothetical protein
MRRSIVAATLLLAVLLAMAAAPQPASADKVTVINYYGAAPFVIGGYSYIPLRDVTDFLGAALLWDSIKNRATITYNGRDIGLVIGSPVVYVMGSAAPLPCAPVLIAGQVYVPSVIFVQHLDVPVIYDVHLKVIKISRGPNAWGTLKVGSPPRGIAVAARLKAPPGHRVKAAKAKHVAVPAAKAAKAGHQDHEKHEQHGAGKGHGKGKNK